jgi:hypothetical protein
MARPEQIRRTLPMDLTDCPTVVPVPRLTDVWICGSDLLLIRADRIVSLVIPVSAVAAAASPDDTDFHRFVYAEVVGGTYGDATTRVKLTDCGKTPAAELLTGLAATLSSAATTADQCAFIFAEDDGDGGRRWVTAAQTPPGWARPQSPALAREPQR